MRPIAAFLIAIVLAAPLAAAQPTSTPAPQPSPDAPPARQPMSEAALLPILRAQIAPATAPAPTTASTTDATLLTAHQQLESFFAPNADRKSITARLDSLHLDPNLLGRLARIRRDWPVIPAGIYFVNNQHGSSRARYWLVIPPGYDRARPCAALLLLPDSAGLSPASLIDQLRQRAADAQKTYPKFIVILPLPDLRAGKQAGEGAGLGPGRLGMAIAMAALNDAADLTDIDPARVCLLGHSQAGLWAWNLALHQPTYFATVEILAANAQATWLRLRMMDLRNTLVVIWNDTRDPIAKFDAARTDANVVKRFGSAVFDQTTGLGHNPPPDLLAHLAESLTLTRRDLYPPHVSIQSTSIEPTYNRADWVLMDQPTDGGPVTHMLASRGNEIIRMYSNTFSVDATCKNNRIDVTTDNTASLRLFLNDQMIDFAHPIIVSVNGREFHRVVHPSLQTMLIDQLFLGRGWRYFTATIDIDLEPATAPATAPSTEPTATTTESPTTRAQD